MADVSIDGTVSTGTARGMRTIAFKRLDASVGYKFLIDADADFSYVKTTDGGATWGTPVQIGPDEGDVAFDICPDWLIPGDTGTKIHMWWFGTAANNVRYNTLDTATDTLGTERTVYDGATAGGSRWMFVSGTKTKSGYLYCPFDINAGTEKGLYRSTDGGVNWSLLSEPFIETNGDQCLAFPASGTGDDNDAFFVYQDASTEELTLKHWDSSAGAAVESANIVTVFDNGVDLLGQYGFSASVRHSDGHLIVAAVTQRDTAIADHRIFDVGGTGSFTEKTAITTDIDDHYHPQVFIDQATDHIYVVYNGKSDGSETLDTATKVYYRKSIDGGITWSAEMPYMEDAAAAVAQVWAPLMGPRFYVGWRIGTTLMGNAVNSLDLSAVLTPISEDNYSFPMQVTAQKRVVTVFA